MTKRIDFIMIGINLTIAYHTGESIIIDGSGGDFMSFELERCLIWQVIQKLLYLKWLSLTNKIFGWKTLRVVVGRKDETKTARDVL